ncbi:putative extracellular sulfatase Sulf-1 homolog [Varroa jacobsoni]|uniref:putative extracellular sulfatase Sulf-1 homolog n=1 Tax=Varroa jacobsoni TaxID=62625 RepID=UPI000BF506E3|nr:putative extracellular sulfatase Sulf-1 homolog [Varroa jacobsoni]
MCEQMWFNAPKLTTRSSCRSMWELVNCINNNGFLLYRRLSIRLMAQCTSSIGILFILIGLAIILPGGHSAPKRKHPHGGKPNIILIVTDDQDIELGSMNFMPHVRRHLEREGAYFPHAYVTTPMCCPSRSSLLTGLYVHNHNVYTNNRNCSSPQWQRAFEPRTFAAVLQKSGYQTGYFGKYLNEYNGNHVPVGWKEWLGLVRNSRFYNYTVSVNGNKVKHGDSYQRDYLPDLITNQSLSFLRRSKQFYPNKPVLMVMAFPGPHGPEDSAPQYQHLFLNETNHRTPSWNHAPNYDKQWILRHTGKMQNVHIKFTDILNTKRLQTLQTVDESVNRVIEELRKLKELDDTFIIYTSDHGYHLGQFGLVKGKAMPFEFDVRVPFYVRGPKISRGIQVPELIANIDIAPTLLEIAGVPADVSMDGKSILPLLMQKMGRRVTTWRDSLLIEKGKISSRERESFSLRSVESAGFNNSEASSNSWTAIDSAKPLPIIRCYPDGKFPSPCRPGQRFECVRRTGLGAADEQQWTLLRCGRLNRSRKQRCRCKSNGRNHKNFSIEGGGRNKFIMDDDLRRFRSGSDSSRSINFRRAVATYRRQLSRNRREYLMQRMSLIHGPPSARLGFSGEILEDETLLGTTGDGTKELVNCVKFSNNQSVICLGSNDEAYRDPRLWEQKKERVDVLINRFRQKLNQLKGLRTTLRRYRPPGVKGSSSGASSSSQRHVNPSDNYNNHNTKNGGTGQVYNEDVDDFDLDDLDNTNGRCFCRDRSKKKRQRKKDKFANTSCSAIGQDIDKMNCFSHDNDHWKTPPLWTDGPFCFCQNANNNTFWCVRTVNRTHNFLYCEFITGFASFYDLRTDPYQLRNTIDQVPRRDLEQMRTSLKRLRRCNGARECTVRYRPPKTAQSIHNADSYSDVSLPRSYTGLRGPHYPSYHHSAPYLNIKNNSANNNPNGNAYNITITTWDNLLRRNINSFSHEQQDDTKNYHHRRPNRDDNKNLADYNYYTGNNNDDDDDDDDDDDSNNNNNNNSSSSDNESNDAGGSDVENGA